MPKIKLKTKGDAESAVFEKSGIKMEFTIDDIDKFIETLDKQKVEVSQELIKHQHMMDKLHKPEVDINKKERFDFIQYIKARNIIREMSERIPELEEAHPLFKEHYEKLTKPEDAHKWYDYREQEVIKEQEFELIDKEREKYLADRKEALSCLETTQK